MMTGPRIGVDILALRRMRDAIETTGEPFLDRVFTRAEQETAARRPDRLAFLAMRFAAKEAVFKALGIDRDGIELTDIEIADGPHGDPAVVLNGRLRELAARDGVEVTVSLAYDDGLAIAVALVSGVGRRPRGISLTRDASSDRCTRT